MVDASLATVPVPVAEFSAQQQSDVPTVVSQEQVTPAVAAAAAAHSNLPSPPSSTTPANISQPPSNTNNTVDVEAGGVDGTISKMKRKRKTTQNDHSHGSFFLRIGAIGKRNYISINVTIVLYLITILAFGLGAMIYNGLEFGAFFEVPFTSPCYMILRGVNPVLQMIFTFMQMYFIFMNSRVSRLKKINIIYY